MIDHIKAKYYKITPSDLNINMARMNATHDINKPFYSVTEQIETAVDFANAGKVLYTKDQVATTAYDLIFDMGYFTDVCLWWNQMTSTIKTWAEFKL